MEYKLSYLQEAFEFMLQVVAKNVWWNFRIIDHEKCKPEQFYIWNLVATR